MGLVAAGCRWLPLVAAGCRWLPRVHLSVLKCPVHRGSLLWSSIVHGLRRTAFQRSCAVQSIGGALSGAQSCMPCAAQPSSSRRLACACHARPLLPRSLRLCAAQGTRSVSRADGNPAISPSSLRPKLPPIPPLNTLSRPISPTETLLSIPRRDVSRGAPLWSWGW